MSLVKLEGYLERITDPNRRSVLRAVKKYVVELEGYSSRVGEFAKRYTVTDPNDIAFYEGAGINLSKDFPTQIAEFKERIVREAINGSIDKQLIENVLAYFCCDVVKIEKLWDDLVNPKSVDGEKELIEKIAGFQKALNGLTWHPRSHALDKSETELIVSRILERLRKHGLKGIGRPFLIRLKVLKKSPEKEGEPVTIEEMEVIANRIEKEVKYWEELLTEHANKCAESKMIKEIMREQKKEFPKITPEIVKEEIIGKISLNKTG